MGACAWPAGGRLGLARVRGSLVRVSGWVSVRARVSVRNWPKCKRPTCMVPTEGRQRGEREPKR